MSEFEKSTPSIIETTPLESGDEIYVHAGSEHIVPYEQWRALTKAALAAADQQPSVERRIDPEKLKQCLIGENARNTTVVLRADKLNDTQTVPNREYAKLMN